MKKEARAGEAGIPVGEDRGAEVDGEPAEIPVEGGKGVCVQSSRDGAKGAVCGAACRQSAKADKEVCVVSSTEGAFGAV